MARPTEHEKRSQLAEKAVEVLEREGLEISTTRLAEALGVKRPTLLYHFPSLGELVEQALRDLLLEQAAYVAGRVAEVEHPLDKLATQLEAVAEFHHGREARVVFLSQAIAALSGSTREAPSMRCVVSRSCRQRRLDALEIPAGGSVELKPGGKHLMFMNLTERLTEGGSVPVTLTFKSGATIGMVSTRIAIWSRKQPSTM